MQAQSRRPAPGPPPDLRGARSMVASLVRFDCFEITVGLRTGDQEHVVTGTPSAVLHCLELTDESAAILWFRSSLAPSRTPCAEARPPGWWG